MAAYVVRKVVHTLLEALGVVTLVFVALRLSGDPASTMLPGDASVDELVALRHALGLDRPLPVQYAQFLAGAVRGDFGDSLRSRPSDSSSSGCPPRWSWPSRRSRCPCSSRSRSASSPRSTAAAPSTWSRWASPWSGRPRRSSGWGSCSSASSPSSCAGCPPRAAAARSTSCCPR